MVYDVCREDLASDAADFVGGEKELEQGEEKDLSEATISLRETGFANCIAKPCYFSVAWHIELILFIRKESGIPS